MYEKNNNIKHHLHRNQTSTLLELLLLFRNVLIKEAIELIFY